MDMVTPMCCQLTYEGLLVEPWRMTCMSQASADVILPRSQRGGRPALGDQHGDAHKLYSRRSMSMYLLFFALRSLFLYFLRACSGWRTFLGTEVPSLIQVAVPLICVYVVRCYKVAMTSIIHDAVFDGDLQWRGSHVVYESTYTLEMSANQAFPTVRPEGTTLSQIVTTRMLDCYESDITGRLLPNSGAIRGTHTQLRHENMSPAVEETLNADRSVCNTVNREKGVSRDFPTSSVTPSAMHEFCEKHYTQILPFMAEKAHNEKLKDVRSRLTYREDTEQETERASHH
nr:reverse transcriptase domain-containing protein [Tanacetum cinerariifolium]